MSQHARALIAGAEPIAPAVPITRRAVFIDALRLIAALEMVMGHTIDALMHSSLRAGPTFEAWSFLRGFTSVAFMVAAGMSYHLSTLARFERHKRDAANAKKRLRRGLTLIAVGYALHLPAGALFGDPSAWRDFFTPDVLQCIGLSLIALESMTILARRPGQVVIACALLAILVLVLAPLTDRVDPSGPLFPITSYLGHRGGARFPLFPWSGFVFAGVVAAHLIAPRSVDRSTTWRALACAGCAFVIAAIVWYAPTLFTTTDTAYSATPALTTLKLAVVLALVAALAAATVRVHRLPRALETLAGETLAVYVTHLVVLYGAGVGLVALLGPTLSVPAAIATGVTMAIGSALFALAWHRAKRRRARRLT